MPDCTNIMAMTEQHSGLRLCKKCDKLLPLDQFNPKKRKFTCKMHMRAIHHRTVLGTHEKRAFNSLRCRARQDQLLLKQPRIHISRKQVKALLTDQQMEDFSHFCLIPKDPTKILSAENVLVVSSLQRKYIMGRWRLKQDVEQYRVDLEFILEAPKVNN